MLLDKDIQYITILINCMPKMMQFAFDLDKHFIEQPGITEFSLSMSYFIGVILTEFNTPLASCPIGNNDIPSGQDFFDITKAQSKAKVPPHRMTDDFSRIPLTCIRIE
jgi:hypothetical protein